ncbi:MAG: helix-turn-helix domain-containing protein [Clostridium neonatale]|uniref:helix-turn-helix domain-containing protein n=1 Tax=Clostridium neonatale TaxID=137838 RepID=UPI00291B8181|nr:putative transcriptional regulator [Clostridium neonatale]
MDIKERIKFYREKRNISKSELARQIGVSPSYITMLENGDKKNPSMEILLKISSALNINVSELSDIDDNIYKVFANNEFKKISQFGCLNEYIKTLGYEIDGDLSEGYLVINAPNGTYEITEKKLEELETTTKSFVLFKLQEIIKSSRKIGK